MYTYRMRDSVMVQKKNVLRLILFPKKKETTMSITVL